eukprot:3410869-Rhodomonas_salina.1
MCIVQSTFCRALWVGGLVLAVCLPLACLSVDNSYCTASPHHCDMSHSVMGLLPKRALALGPVQGLSRECSAP